MQGVIERTQKETESIVGLSSADVQQRLRRGESNEYEARVGRSYWDIFRENVLNLFNIVLGSLLIGVILLGDYATAIFAGFSVVSNTFFGMIQEFSAKRQLDRLAALSEQNVPCLRDGKWIDVPMRKVVKDEMIRVEPGDRLVVDGEIARSDSLEMDESLLTGESEAISKVPGDDVFSGSFCNRRHRHHARLQSRRRKLYQPAFNHCQAIQDRQNADPDQNRYHRRDHGLDYVRLCAADLHHRFLD